MDQRRGRDLHGVGLIDKPECRAVLAKGFTENEHIICTGRTGVRGTEKAN